MQFVRCAAQIIAHVKSAIVLVQLRLDLVAGPPEYVHVLVPQDEADPWRRVVQGVVDLDFIRVRDIPNKFTQPQRRFLGGQVANFRRGKIDDGEHTVATRTRVPALDQFTAAALDFGALLDFLDEFAFRLLQLIEHGKRTFVRRAGRQYDVDVDDFVLHFRHESELDPAT